MSSSDIWHPEQPSSQTVAIVAFSIELSPSRIMVKVGQEVAAACISATAFPFSTSAPVGQTCTHLPQPVQISRIAPRLAQIGDHARLDAAAHDVPGVRAFHLVANAYAARAEYAAVVVER